jgi:hypothetical protein
LEYSEIYHKFAENIILNSKKGGSMKKLVFFISLSMLILAGCSVKKDGNFTRVKIDRQRTVWINKDIECCGVKDPANNLEWFKKYTNSLMLQNVSYRTFLYGDTIIPNDYIVILRRSTVVNSIVIYDCNGIKIGGGPLNCFSDIVACKSFLRQMSNSELEKKHKHSEQNNRSNNKRKLARPSPCFICDEFLKTHVLVDTISYFNKP